jgi:Ca2+-transporting ATPase
MAPAGLTSAVAAERLARVGRNELRAEAGPSRWKLWLGQLSSPLVWLLLAACVVSALLGEAGDAVAIGVIVVVNATVGFLQESRAERALLALRAATAPRARVLRDGRQAVIAAAEVVPGDLLLLEAGDLVAADARVTEAHRLAASEAALTGESAPVVKTTGPAPEGVPLAEQRDRVFMGTAIAAGSGAAEVAATGTATELGKIAHLIESATREPTPLERRLAAVGRVLLYLCLAIVAVTALLGLLRGRPWLEVMMSGVSLAVAAIPEGLPAIVTIALAVGVQRMAAKNVLVRRLSSVETLGSATVICTDKTGTLTTGVMVVRDIWGADPDRVLATAAACCDAELGPGGTGGTGDPTELAILSAASARGITRERIEAELPRRAVEPFDPERRLMSILRADGVLYVKGALEALAPSARGELAGAAQAVAAMAGRGLRVLAVGTGARDGDDLDLVGLLGIADAPRPEAIEAVAAARGAGVRTIMITGDDARTARAIAREMGILEPGDDEAETVHARATPEQKLRVVRGWKARGAVVAMTGDGVNDAPALREAHIGIAMGRTGTEVTREASDMVLADDNFASVVAAVREGRGIFNNIRKALVYLLAGNTGELLLMLGGAVAGLPLPLLPLQLLWVNLVTDGLPALALVLDPPPADAMQRPPRAPSEPMLGRAEWANIGITGLLQGALALGTFAWALRSRPLIEARSLAFTTLVLGELFRAFASRSTTSLYWEVGPLSNVRLLGVVALSAVVQIALHHTAFVERVFDIAQLDARDSVLCVLLGLIPVTLIELAKLARRWWS